MTTQQELTNEGNVLFPVFFKLHTLHTLIVGGGNVGLEKLEAIMRNSPTATVTLVADTIKNEIYDLQKAHPTINIEKRQFSYMDLEGKDLVILATDNKDLHRCIKAATTRLHLMTNVADTPELCDFYLSSIVKKGDLKIAISTNGKSPTIAKRLREYLEEALPDNVQTLLDRMTQIRASLKGDFAYKVQKLNEVTTQWLKDK
jgi:siroheme synthase-like protein